MSKFAAHTKVPESQSRAEIEKILGRYHADRFMWFKEPQRAVLIFEGHGRRVRFDLPVPDATNDKTAQQARQRWRALVLCIKAKLESVETGIETFEEAFLAHVVMPDGKTVADHTKQRIASAYDGGEVQALLPPPREVP